MAYTDDTDLNAGMPGGGLLGGSSGGWLGNLLKFNGGRSTTADLYGDLFTKKQLEAIQQRESDSRFAGLLGAINQFAAPSEFKKGWGQLLGTAAQAMLGAEGGDKAATTALGGQKTAAQIAQLRTEMEANAVYSKAVREAYARLRGAPGTGAAPPGMPAPGPVPPPGAPTAPTAPPPGPTPDAPVPNPAGAPTDPFAPPPIPYAGPFSAPARRPFGMGAPVNGPDSAPPPRTQNTGLPAGLDPNQQFAGLLGGGAQPPFPPTEEEGSLPPPDTVIPSNGPGGLLDPGAIQPAAMGFGGGAVVAPWARGNAAMGGRSSVEGLQGEFAGRLKTMIEAMPPELQARFKIESGFRDAARQQQVNPGVTNSRHTHGIAVDTNRDPEVQAWITANGPKFGVGYTLAGMKNEDNHLEMLGPDGGRVGGLPIMRAQYSPGGGGAAPAPSGGGGGLGEAIPGLGISVLDMAELDALAAAAGKRSPFKSLMDAYYKDPAYLGRAAGAEASARKDVEFKMDPLIAEQRRRAELKVDTELRPKLEQAIETAKNGPLEKRAQAEAEIARLTKQIEQEGAANWNIVPGVPIEIPGQPMREYTLTGKQVRDIAEGKAVPEQGIPAGARIAKPSGLGQIPPGYQYTPTPQGGFTATPIPGSPAEREAAEAAEKKKLADQSKRISTDFVVSDIDLIREKVSKYPSTTTGVVGGWLSKIDATEAGEIRNLVEGIESNVMLDRMLALKSASSTGATGMGSLTEKEGERLVKAYGSLKQSQGTEQFLRNLDRLQGLYIELLHGPAVAQQYLAERKAAAAAQKDATSGPGGKAYGPVRRID